MSRIKFLDILEETKSQPQHTESSQNISTPTHEYNTTTVNSESFRRRERTNLTDAQDKLANLREKSLLRDTGINYEPTKSTLSSSSSVATMSERKSDHSSLAGMDDNKTLLTGALFVLFGGILFLSGYWVGKTITSNVRAERGVMMAQSMNDLKKEAQLELASSLPAPMPPVASTVDTIPAKQPIEVVEPAVIPTVQKSTPKPKVVPAAVPTTEYIIQISAHSTIESARTIEDKLRDIGFTAYTSENTIGDNVFFRVRLRGFSSKKSAQETLAQIKSHNMGQDGFVLTLD